MQLWTIKIIFTVMNFGMIFAAMIYDFYSNGAKRFMRFEDLQVWRKAVKLCSEIYRGLGNINDFTFKNQITKSALSISSSITEGFERDSDKECLRFLIYAKGSCGELRLQIYIGMQIGYIRIGIGSDWVQQAIEVSNMLAGLIKTKRNYIRDKE